MTQNRRRHKRFSATAFLNRHVHVTPLPPFFGEPIQGRLIDLSAGGMSIAIEKIIPQGTNLHIEVTFPDRSKVSCDAQVRHTLPWHGKYLHGFEFLNLAAIVGERIDRMSSDYINCEARIVNGASEICQSDCAFYTMCTKTEKVGAALDPDIILELAFRTLDDSPLARAP